MRFRTIVATGLTLSLTWCVAGDFAKAKWYASKMHAFAEQKALESAVSSHRPILFNLSDDGFAGQNFFVYAIVTNDASFAEKWHGPNLIEAAYAGGPENPIEKPVPHNLGEGCRGSLTQIEIGLFVGQTSLPGRNGCDDG